MSDKLSIKVTVGGRTYPLTIDRSEEEVIRKAANKINDSIVELRDNYAVKDMQDLLAMAILQSESLLLKATGEVEKDEVESALTDLEATLCAYLG